MRTRSLSLAITLTAILATSVLAAQRPQQPRTQDPQQGDVTVVERCIRAVKKSVRTFDQPAVPIPGNASTTT